MATNPVDPYAQIYRSVQRREQSQQRAFQGSSLEQAMQDERDNQIRLGIIAAPAPEQVAKATKIAREKDVPPGEVDGNLAYAEKAQQADYMTGLFGRFPALAKWAAGDPRGVAAAADDHKSLGMLGEAWDWLKMVPGRLGAGSYSAGAGLREFTDPIANAGAYVNAAVQAPIQTVLDAAGINKGYDPFAAAARSVRENDANRARMRAEADRIRTANKSDNQYIEALLSGFESIPVTLGAILTRNPEAALGIMGVSAGGQGYRAARDKGLPVGTSLTYGTLQGGFEALTEKIPASSLIEALAKKTPFGKVFVEQLAQELPSEQVATVLQDFTEWAYLNPDKPFSQFVAERPAAAVNTALATVTGSATVTGATVALDRTAQAAAKVAGRVEQSRIAKAHGTFFDKAGKAAEQSKLRERDPEAYAAALRAQADETGAKFVYIPGEAAQAYMQSDSYDPDGDPFSAWADDAAEAYSTGGDIVIPIEQALTKLPGSPAWAALKDDMRLVAGGISAREAQTFDDAIGEVMGALTDQMAAQDAAEAKGRTVRQKLLDSVAGMLGTGYTSPVARSLAELAVSRVEARAAALGKEVTGNEFDNLEIRTVLPESVALAKSADSLDLTINAMRKGKATSAQGGKSLLEWISARGGIEDPGGDIASMGADKWHLLDKPVTGKTKKGKAFTAKVIPGRRKLLKPSSAAQGNMIGGEFNPNTIENTLDAAISEGFFPDLYALRETGTDYADKIDTGVLLAAIGDSLAGRDLYAQDARTDVARAAADDLRQYLEAQGYSPDEMGDGDIRALIQSGEGQSDQAGYEQLPEVVEIDGVERPTRNSEGMPLAGSVEGVRAFYAWFGDSKVVDDEGRPLVVYHGTGTNIEAFNGITWASVGTDLANEYASMREVLGQGIATVLPLYVRAERIFDADAGLSKSETVGSFFNGALEQSIEQGREIDLERARVLLDTIRTAGKREESGPRYDRHDFWNKSAEMFGRDGAEAIREMFGLMGFDGIKMRENGSDTFGAFSPTQIKSINNRGTFDPADARILYQARDGGPRGKISGFNGPRIIIELFQNRNLSTVFHEFGHMWLEELAFDATTSEASDQLKADWETVKAWFAANGNPLGDNGTIPVEAHELWARGIERYVMEGKAPSTGMKRLFETFRTWMLSIYKTVEALRTPITPEIRSVMDRLLATDEQIAAMREEQALSALFNNAADIGMSEAEFAAYREQVADARAEAQGKVLEKAMRSERAKATKEYREARKGVRSDVEADVLSRPMFRAFDLLKTQPMDAGWIRDEMGEDALALLPKRVPPVYTDGGANPSTIAEMAGYATGKQMIEALIGAEVAHRQLKEGGDQRTLRNRMIDTETDAEMNRRYGDPLNDGSIEREALAAVHNDKQGEVIASELRVLARTTGNRPTPYAMARDWARGRVRGGVVAVEASPGAIERYRRAAAKAGRLAETAMLDRNVDEAFRQKQLQMLNNALVSEAKAAADEVEAAVKRMGKIGERRTMKSVDQDYLEQAQALLEAVDLKRRSQKGIDRQGSWETWAAEREAEGFDVAVPASFEATIAKTNWSRLTVEQLLMLDEAVKQVMHLGRLKQTLLDNKEQREWDEIFTEAEASAGGLDQRPPRGSFDDPTWWDSIKARVATWDAALLKMETVFDWLDRGNPNGVFNRVVFRPMAEAQARESAMLADYYGRIREAMGRVPKETLRKWDEKVTLDLIDPATGLPITMSRQKLVAMALNVGNEGNLQRLTDGYGWNANGVLAALNDNLTEEEWRFVQETWDVINTLWPQIEAMERDINGFAPEKVDPRPVETPYGVLPGGYYPAIYDTSLDLRAEEQAGKRADLFEANYVRATTRSSATKDRAEKVRRPILLDLGVINRHLGEVIHDVTHRRAVMQAHRFLTNERVARAVEQALGPEVRKQFRPWLKHIANSWAMERAGSEGIGKFLSKLRANTTVVGMGFRFTTILTQIAGYSNSFEAVGERWVVPAIAQVAAHPVQSFEFVMERSDEVRFRMDNLDRDIRQSLNELAGKASPLTAAKRFAFHGIGYMDRVVVIPTWIGAYNKALSEGMTEQDAAYAADKAIRQSQGAGAPKDLAAVQTGAGRFGELLKYMTMFYSYMSAQYQRQRTLGRDIKGTRDLPRLMARAWWLVVVPPLLSAILTGNGPDDDEDWGFWTLRKMLGNALGPIPLVRDVFEPAWAKATGVQGFDYQMSPVQSAMKSFVNVAGDAGRVVRGEETKRATRDVLETVGYFTGLVPGQVAASTQFLVDVGSGDADPDGFWDWYTGMTKGRLPED